MKLLLLFSLFNALNGFVTFRNVRLLNKRQISSFKVTENPFQEIDNQVKIFDDLRTKLKGTCVYFVGMMVNNVRIIIKVNL